MTKSPINTSNRSRSKASIAAVLAASVASQILTPEQLAPSQPSLEDQAKAESLKASEARKVAREAAKAANVAAREKEQAEKQAEAAKIAKAKSDAEAKAKADAEAAESAVPAFAERCKAFLETWKLPFLSEIQVKEGQAKKNHRDARNSYSVFCAGNYGNQPVAKNVSEPRWHEYRAAFDAAYPMSVSFRGKDQIIRRMSAAKPYAEGGVTQGYRSTITVDFPLPSGNREQLAKFLADLRDALGLPE